MLPSTKCCVSMLPKAILAESVSFHAHPYTVSLSEQDAL